MEHIGVWDYIQLVYVLKVTIILTIRDYIGWKKITLLDWVATRTLI